MFIRKGIYGKDLNKNYSDTSPDNIPKVPEAQGVITACIFLITTISWIPFIANSDGVNMNMKPGELSSLDTIQLLQLFAALLCICSMTLLGFADDILDLKWRHKLLLPAIASLPLLVVYSITSNRTEVVIPLILRPWIGSTIDLGVCYYIYMGMLAIFCTNAINILAGINGIEVGQSVIIATSIAIFNYGELSGPLGNYHKFSLYLLLPYLATSLPLLWYNWYPSEVFPGDTFCYFSGMTFAVVAILGHFSKTLLLFFIPQVINFVYSSPQLFKLLPCPRHRLPKYCDEKDNVEMRMVTVKENELNTIGRFILKVLKFTGLGHINEYKDGEDVLVEFNNLTIINLTLKFVGPVHERNLTCILICFQLCCSCIAFFIRYPLALWFYGHNVF